MGYRQVRMRRERGKRRESRGLSNEDLVFGVKKRRADGSDSRGDYYVWMGVLERGKDEKVVVKPTDQVEEGKRKRMGKGRGTKKGFRQHSY